MIKFGSVLFIFFFVMTVQPVFSFRPVAHVVLQRTIAEKLPKDNAFKKAMDNYPHFAAWGAVGPDLAYVPKRPLTPRVGYKRKMARLLNNADLAHYYKTGEFSKTLVKKAFESEDERLIAFAAGWLTHIGGDFGAHGIFVYPEAGYYLNNIEGRLLHSKMEQFAEPIIFIERGGRLTKNKEFYKDDNLEPDNLYENFFGQELHFFSGRIRRKEIEDIYEPTIVKLLNEVFNELYDDNLKTDFAYGMRNYDEAFGKGLSVEEFDLKHYEEGKEFFKDSTMLREMNEGFDFAVDYCVNLFKEANNKNYNSFLSTWNLDVGEIANTLVIKCVIDEESQHGTTHPIKMQLKLNTALTVPINYNFFKKIRYKRGDILFAYVYLNECDLDEDKIYSFKLTKDGKHDDTVIKTFEVYLNGVEVYKNKEKIKLNRDNPITDHLKFNQNFVLAR